MCIFICIKGLAIIIGVSHLDMSMRVNSYGIFSKLRVLNDVMATCQHHRSVEPGKGWRQPFPISKAGSWHFFSGCEKIPLICLGYCAMEVPLLPSQQLWQDGRFDGRVLSRQKPSACSGSYERWWLIFWGWLGMSCLVSYPQCAAM